MRKRKSKVKMFFFPLELGRRSRHHSGSEYRFYFTMEQASGKTGRSPGSIRGRERPAFSSAQPPKSGAAQANAKPEESPAEDDRIVLVNYAKTMPEDFHRNIVNLYGVDVDELHYGTISTDAGGCPSGRRLTVDFLRVSQCTAAKRVV